MNEQFIKDVTKSLKSTAVGELPAGSTPRRYEPEGGLRRHRERIHKESKEANSKNLPFSFSKPKKPKGRSTYKKCDKCGYITSTTTATVGIICPECKEFSSVTELEEHE